MKAKQENIVKEREKKLAQKQAEKEKEKLRALAAKQAEKNLQKKQVHLMLCLTLFSKVSRIYLRLGSYGLLEFALLRTIA